MDTYAHVDSAAFQPPTLSESEVQRLLANLEFFLARAPSPQQCQELARRLGNLVRSAA